MTAAKPPKGFDGWETPRDFFARLDDEFAFLLDACADFQTAKCQRFFSKQSDALQQSWNIIDEDAGSDRAGAVYFNPPYSNPTQARFVRHAYEQSRLGATVVGLILSATDTTWWHEYVMRASEIRFLSGRLHFLFNGVPYKNNRYTNVVAIWRPGVEGPVVQTMQARI